MNAAGQIAFKGLQRFTSMHPPAKARADADLWRCAGAMSTSGERVKGRQV
jgi:hypothetical protein